MGYCFRDVLALGDLAAEPPDSLVAAAVAEAAGTWGVPIDAVTLSTAVARSWPDQRLGCLPDRRAAGDQPVRGWQITLTCDEQVAVYHTDASKRFVRCSDSHRRGPIM